MSKNNTATQQNSELVIGLVAAVGTDTANVIRLLKERLSLARYTIREVKVSRDIIPLLCPVPPDDGDNYKRIANLMDRGNEARETTKKNEVLALGAAARVFAMREKPQVALIRTAVIIDSLKRPEEVEELRRVYPGGFVLVGVHSEESQRHAHLVNNLGMTAEQADDLILRDRDEVSVEHGQRVNETFHLADFFVRLGGNFERLRCDVKRMVELWFGNPFVTPTFDEHAMFLAFSAALRSADLSRQVGAVVARNSQILATGANECPAAGGGLYWASRQANGCIEDVANGRDWMRQDGDSNVAEQNRIIKAIVSDAVDAGIDPDKLRKVLQQSGIRNLTEYGRVVHAEMEALLSCARNGLSTVGATLYSTTFPCHNCAKHIIGAGIERVVYVQPYSKSKTLEFHNDSISTGLSGEQAGLVKFVPFVGIGPRRFFDLFSMQLGSTYRLVRKHNDTGKKVDWSLQRAQLRLQLNPNSYLESEQVASADFANYLPKRATQG